MGRFVLRKIVLDEACGSKLKILVPGEFVFTDAKYDNFFMDGVAIQAIVGKNGCGKSSLIEMIFRMSNNLAALMLRGYERPAAEHINYITDVVGELHYEVDGVAGMLKCEKERVTLALGDESFTWVLDTEGCVHTTGRYKYNNETRFEKEVKAAALYFYTVATNYSMQSYITDDYSAEKILGWNEEEKTWKETHEATSWIDGVFHKNDGYMSPIVLNPYRQDGTIDMAKEERLTISRLCSLLWETKDALDENQLIDGYRLLDIGYDFYIWPFIQKFDKKVLKNLPEGPFTSQFVWAYGQDYSIAKSILTAYELEANRKMSILELSLRAYLAYKTLSIANKYPSYSHFKALGDVNLVFQSKEEESYHELIVGLVNQVKGDMSHITLKIRQTRKLISEIQNPENIKILENRFTYRKYINMQGYPERAASLDERTEMLPPPVFRAQIFLVKNDIYKRLHETEQDVRARWKQLWDNSINLNHLSSGERQFIYTTSTLVYHAMNLKSIPEVVRMTYKNICMILDEIEICFHPEYQRTFISKFIALMKRTGLAENFGINVLVVTHSPFVLSDIPQGNIMYLKEGYQLTGEELKAEGITNPFCANINDILHQSFFLEKGFVGEFARQKVLSLVAYLKEEMNRDEWTPEKAREFIKIIGEPLVREQLLGLYKESVVAGVRDKIALYREEIQRLERGEG